MPIYIKIKKIYIEILSCGLFNQTEPIGQINPGPGTVTEPDRTVETLGFSI